MFERSIEHLILAKRMKGMFFGSSEVSIAKAYLVGFRRGVSTCGSELTMELWEQAVKERGWKQRPLGPEWEMRKKGMNDEAVIDEFIEIEVATHRLAEQYYATLTNGSQTAT